MRKTILLLLALAMVFGCAQNSGDSAGLTSATGESTVNETQQIQNESQESEPVENDTQVQPPAESGEVTLEVKFSEVDLTQTTVEVRKTNPECYPDATKCALEDIPMHIFEDVEHEFYNLSSKGDVCLLSIGNREEGDSLHLVEYTIENQDSESHMINPELLVRTDNSRMGYVVTSPYTKTNCSSFYDESVLEIELGPSESRDFKAVIVIPETETPLSASLYVDGEAE